MLFPAGMLQVLSHPLASRLAASSEVGAFVDRATRLITVREWDRTEDVALGFWLQQLLAVGQLPNVSFCAQARGRHTTWAAVRVMLCTTRHATRRSRSTT